MGTNYYFRNSKKEEVHVGKKSAAGFYCWECNVTLCKEGNRGVHFDKSSGYDHCPNCGKRSKKETLLNSAAGRELGFNKEPYQRKVGVASCSSFSWAIFPYLLPKGVKIEDEYGRKFSIKEFKQILEECPIQYFHNVGKEFC